MLVIFLVSSGRLFQMRIALGKKIYSKVRNDIEQFEYYLGFVRYKGH